MSDRCPFCGYHKGPEEMLECEECGHPMCNDCSGERDDGAIICRDCEKKENRRKARGKA